ncbi:hypothetical protein GE115_11220 [Agromyces sp. CFH 90414]|uniref:O-antigen ligase domain-containing protein n=1 Tax=Agromyces agglutinans TaxID=2662258 RepID=A0A6I2F7Z1_9MICO|nr:hypothetical protein [Agromyces agglutinans]MRG60431.1 hypothetical protein [Agromyces agglutinans]
MLQGAVGLSHPEVGLGLSARAARGVTVSVVVVVVGALISYKLGGRFAVSNIAQIVGLAILMVSVPRALRARDVVLVLLSLGGVLAGGLAVSNIYGYGLALEYLAFYTLMALWLFWCHGACRRLGAQEAIAHGFAVAIPIALLVIVAQLGLDLQGGADRRRLGFDDKSHASIYCCFLAFASLRFLRGRARLVVSLVFFVIAFLTISRLPFIFAPLYFVAFLGEYRRVRAEAKTPLDVYVVHLLMAGVVLTPVLLAARAAGLFASFGRVFQAGERTDASTQAHLLLLEYAARLKIADPGSFLFGVTPGGFASVLARSDIDISSFAAIDPPGYEKVLEGIAPMHSSLGSILLEFPIWVAAGYLVLAAWALWALLRRGETVLALFLVSFFVATVFYSSQTELYFAVAWTAVIAMATTPSVAPSRAGRENAGSVGQRAHRSRTRRGSATAMGDE